MLCAKRIAKAQSKMDDMKRFLANFGAKVVFVLHLLKMLGVVFQAKWPIKYIAARKLTRSNK
jgi:hypothetical protein